MADLNIVVEKLHGFETADDLADYFRQYGIKAQPQNARACAISKFVVEETGLEGNIITSFQGISLQETVLDVEGCEYQTDVSFIQHTHALIQFVQNFDSGKYSFLVEEGYEYDPSNRGANIISKYCECNECIYI